MLTEADIIVNCIKKGGLDRFNKQELFFKYGEKKEAYKLFSLQIFSLAIQGNMEKLIIGVYMCPTGELGDINKVKAGVSCN